MRTQKLGWLLVMLIVTLGLGAQETAESGTGSQDGYEFILGAQQQPAKFMKSKSFNMLTTDGNTIIAYEMSLGKLTFVRFDKNFTVSQEVVHKAIPKDVVSMRVKDNTIEGVFSDKNSVVHVSFDKETFAIKKQQVLLTQEKYRKFADKYTDVFVRFSDNGKYIALLAMWDHKSVALAFNSNHVYLYDENFEQLGYWSLDEDKRCIGMGSKENAGNWEHYHPVFDVYDDGTVVYAALHDIASNLYAELYGTGSSLNVHILSKDGSQKDYDFGKPAGATKLMYPCIVSFSQNELVLKANYARYPKDGRGYNVDGYKIMKCDLANKQLKVESFENSGGMYYCNNSIDGGLPYAKHIPEVGYMLMVNRGFVLIGEDYHYISTQNMGPAYYSNGGPITPATNTESNSVLFKKFIDNKLNWLDYRTNWSAGSKMPYTTTLHFVTYTPGTSSRLNITELYKDESKEIQMIDCCPYSNQDNKYLVLINKCQWADIELK